MRNSWPIFTLLLLASLQGCQTVPVPPPPCPIIPPRPQVSPPLPPLSHVRKFCQDNPTVKGCSEILEAQ